MRSIVGSRNAIGVIRVSTVKQGYDGDSPEAQKEQIERYAAGKNIIIKKYFVFLESASKEQQPMQEAINYCKDPENQIDLFIVKSIDRFTRGGSDFYSALKQQLEQYDISLVDIYGVINPDKVNTLEHLGFEYKWSSYHPSKKSEILEAERAKDELRDIMSRMIGAEIRYTQMGYYMRQPPFGYESKKIDTPNGKRPILVPHPEEAQFIVRMFEMRASGKYSDAEIAKKLNALGFQTRIEYARNPANRNQVIKRRGGVPLNAKHLWRLVRSPIYAGVNREKWTSMKPVKCMFNGLVSIELFNKANKGRVVIVEGLNNDIQIVENSERRGPNVYGGKSSEYPYKKYILCPQCKKPLHGSASRGKSGKYYPAYHCDKQGHYFRVTKAALETQVINFVQGLSLSSEKFEALSVQIEKSWDKAHAQQLADIQLLDGKVQTLEQQAAVTVEKIKVLNSTTAIKYMEEDLMKIERDIENTKLEKAKAEARKPVDIHVILKRVKYLVEHLDELLVKQIDPIKKAQFFGALFDTLPTFTDLQSGTLSAGVFTGVNPVFLAISGNSIPVGEPTSIFLEHLFDDLFRLRDNFKALGMVLKDGEVYLPDLGDMK